MNKEEIEKAKIVLWNIRANTLKAMQCSLAGTKDKEEWLKEIDGIDDIFKYIQQLNNKASVLDEVTDRLEIANSKYIEEYKKVENLILIDGNTAVLQELSCIIYDLEEILNIIKRENRTALNSKEKEEKNNAN